MRALLLAFLILAAPSALAQERVPPAPIPPFTLSASPDAAPSSVQPADPSQLTTEAVDRLALTLKELFAKDINAINVRLDDQQKDIDALLVMTKDEIKNLRELMDEKFLGRDKALDAALTAQVKSVDDKNKSNADAIFKNEQTTAGQIDDLKDLISTQSLSSDDGIEAVKGLIASEKENTGANIADIKGRLTTIETQRSTGRESTGDTQASWGVIFGVTASIAALITILGGLATAVVIMTRKPEPPTRIVERVVVPTNGNGHPA